MRATAVRLTAIGCLLGSGFACRTTDRPAAADSASSAASVAPASPGAPAPATSARDGKMGGMHDDTLVARVTAHLGRLATASPDSLRALVPADREIVTALIADCEQMMRQMKMEPPRKWRNVVSDLRQDLDRLATLSGPPLQQLMTEHRKRIENVLSMRHDMMQMM